MTKHEKLDPKFVEAQKRRLLAIRDSLSSAERANAAESSGLTQPGRESEEYEDDAQKLAQLDLEGSLAQRDVSRLERINRALAKVAEGTYGMSDESGAPIGASRLEAVPEAIFTLEEEKRHERNA
jgi:DnaK suppressor protein